MTVKSIKSWSAKQPSKMLVILAISGLYFLTRLIALTSLPVFADEAIYIRWAQLLNQDQAYLFFSINDGKPPLFIWLTALVLNFGTNPLWQARLVSVMIGWLQLIVSDRILKTLGGSEVARLIQAILIILLPFWFFHHRMALMDSLLVLGLSLSFWGVVETDKWLAQQHFSSLSDFKKHWWQILTSVCLGGVGWGVALWTKTPALFFAGVIFFWAIFGKFEWWSKNNKRNKSLLLARILSFGLLGLIGLLIFLLLKVFPAFGSLFSRSSDFSFTFKEIVAGQWVNSINNFGRMIKWLSTYLRPEVFSLPFIALVVSKKWKTHLSLIISALILALPFVVLGRTIHPRYYLPLAPFLTISAAFLITEANQLINQRQQINMRLVFWLLVGSFLIGVWRFILLSWITPDQTPFVLADRTQYLTEWSSGHGIAQTRDEMIKFVRTNQTNLTVITEGSFGTLPDGLLMYFDKLPEIQYLSIQGLEQYPVRYIPDWVWEKSETETVWLVVNEHRLQLSDSADYKQLNLLRSWRRPYGGPALQLYEVRNK